MPKFNLSEDTISRLRTKFAEFQNARKRVHALLADYVADYRQFNGNPSDRREFLERKYAPRVPDFSHILFDDSQIFFNVSDIAILLGRTQPAISITLSNIEKSQGWVSRLLPLHKQTKSANGNKIFVYSEGIFDLLIDKYEDEYLLRFSKPRRGNQVNAPDIEEIRKFWKYLHDIERHNEFLALRQQTDLPDVPAMSLKDILALIWDKVFNVRIGTIASLIFAVCFEVARRYFSVSLWVSIVPAVVIAACVILIHHRYAPDTLSDFAAGSLLFLMLWISGSLSLYKSAPLKVAQNITLSPTLSGNNILFNISATHFYDINEFLYRISPDTLFHSTAFTHQINPQINLPYPKTTIQNNSPHGITHIEVKFRDSGGHESDTWLFSFDIDAIRFNLCKQYILSSKEVWLEARRINDKVFLMPYASLSSTYGKSSVHSLVYGINTSSPDTFVSIYDINIYELLTLNTHNVNFVSSYLIFDDGSSSDVRVSYTEL
ncbi:MAG: hypothetical protein II876_00035 [Synergistaceae bacterium]|nr:hypothetical protein [Synergistaceae bacterium]MBR0279195.1 hypothetical protein [Synergistaceae bacterium]